MEPERFEDLVKRAFTKTEWECLEKNHEFQTAFAQWPENIESFQRLANLGDQILDSQGKRVIFHSDWPSI